MATRCSCMFCFWCQAIIGCSGTGSRESKARRSAIACSVALGPADVAECWAADVGARESLDFPSHAATSSTASGAAVKSSFRFLAIVMSNSLEGRKRESRENGASVTLQWTWRWVPTGPAGTSLEFSDRTEREPA